MCGCLLMAKKYEEAERWLAAAAAFVPVSKEPAPLLQASSPSINIVRVNTRTLLQPRYYHNNINTAIAWVKKSVPGLDRGNLAEF